MAQKDSNPKATLSLVFLCFVLVLSEGVGRTAVVPHVDLRTLVEGADLIVVGRVTSEKKLESTTLGPAEGDFPAWLTMVRLDAERVIKGKPEVHTVDFRAVLPVEGVGAEAPRYKAISVGQFGVFFLRKAETGYAVLDPYHPFVPAAPGAPRQARDYLDAVVGELAHTFDSNGPSVKSRWERWEGVTALETLQTSAATDALRIASKDPDPLVRIWAISALLARNDIPVLEQVEKLGPISGDPNVINLTSQLGFAIGKISDARAIPSLARLLNSKDVNIRRGAAAGLRNTRDGAAIQPLTQALFDTDRDVQYQAVIGLAEITGTVGEWAPAYPTFLTARQRYVRHWQEWAKERK